MVDPDVTGAKDGNAIAISQRPPPIVGGGAAHHGVPCLDAVMDMDAVDDDVGDVLEGDAGAVGDVDVGAAAVDGLEAVHDELLLEGDDHVTLEHDPQGPVLDDGVTEGARFWIDCVVVGGVGDNVVTAVAPADGVAAEADGAVGKALAAEVPAPVAAPAVVDWVPGPT